MEAYKQYLLSEQWKSVSQIRRCEIDKNKCVLCGSDNGLNVHHIFYRNNWYDTEVSDLVTLCNSCHLAVHRVQEQLDRYTERHAEEQYIPGVRKYITPIFAVLCWEKNKFATNEVSKLCNGLVDIVKQGGRDKCPAMTGDTMNMLAVVKDCYIANSKPRFDKSKRKEARKRHTKYK